MASRSEADQDALDAKLMEAIMSHDCDSVAHWLQTGANPNNPERMPFCFAAANGDLPVVAVMAQMGADPNQQDPNGNTPLIYAIQNNRTEICDYLLQEFPHISLQNERKSALLATIQPEYREEMMIRLLDAGAEPHAACPHDTRHFTCFDEASERQLGDAMHLMNQYGRTNLPDIATITHEDVAASGKPLLQHPEGWKQFSAITARLESLGTPLTKADLTRSFGDDERSYLRRAAECYHLRDAIEYLNGRGEKLTDANLLTDKGTPNTLLTICMERKALNALLSPANWVGQPTEAFSRVWSAIPDKEKAQADNPHVLMHSMREAQKTENLERGR